MATKTLQTRIALKYDSYSAWTSAPGKDLVLLKGELGICYIGDTNPESHVVPTVLFKVGDGTKTFEKLPWASAKAADVYSWAKASEVKLVGKKLTFVGGGVDGSNVEVPFDYVTLNEVKEITDGLASRIAAVEASVGTGKVAEDITAIKGRLDVIEGADTVEGSVAKALKDAKAYTDAREVEINKYADKAEEDAIATAKGYTDTEVKKASDAAADVASDLSAHVANKENPHEVTKAQVGLGNVDNKSVAEIKTEFTGEVAADNEGFVTGGAAHTAIEAAKSAANTYADGLNTAMDTRVGALEAAKTAQDTKNGELEQAIEDEASARGTAITNATNAITSAYEAADLAINNKIGTVTEGKTVVEMISDAQTAAEGKVTALANGQVETNRAAIAEMDAAYKKAVENEAKARDDADKAIDERLDKVEAFFEGAAEDSEGLNNALDKLVDIQNYLAGEGSGADGLMGQVSANTTAIENLQKEFNTETGRVKVAEGKISALEAKDTELANADTTLGQRIDGVITDYKAADTETLNAAKGYTDNRETAITTAYKAYAEAEADAAETAAKSYADEEIAELKGTLEAADSAITAEVAKKLAISDFTAHETGHAKSATEITAEIAAAVKEETDTRVEAVNGINARLGTFEGTVADIKTTADTAKSDLAALTTRVGTAETAIATEKSERETAISGIDTAYKAADKAINDKIGTVTGTVGEAIADAKKAGTDAAAAVDALSKGQVATNKSDIADIKADYLKAADFFIIDCGTSVLREGEPTAQ